MKQYKSQNFVKKIEVNLANISAKPNDKFQLIKAYYDINSFDCDLCGHKNCMYAYEVKNLQTGAIMKVGSECIHHFKDKGVDINLAEGLMRRVTAASNKARRDLRYRLGKEVWDALSDEERGRFKFWEHKAEIDRLGKIAYNALPKEEKRELVVNEYLTLQTKELLVQVSYNKSILTEEDVQLILQLNMEEEMQGAITKQKIAADKNKIKAIEDRTLRYIREAEVFDPQKMLEMSDEINTINPDYNFAWIGNAMQNRLDEDDKKEEIKNEYAWLLDYKGNNPTVRDIRSYLLKHKTITPAQQNLAFSLVEDNPKDEDFDKKIEELHNKPFNDFIDSVYRQYKRKGYVSEKQKTAVLKAYDKL